MVRFAFVRKQRWDLFCLCSQPHVILLWFSIFLKRIYQVSLALLFGLKRVCSFNYLQCICFYEKSGLICRSKTTFFSLPMKPIRCSLLVFLFSFNFVSSFSGQSRILFLDLTQSWPLENLLIFISLFFSLFWHGIVDGFNLCTPLWISS